MFCNWDTHYHFLKIMRYKKYQYVFLSVNGRDKSTLTRHYFVVWLYQLSWKCKLATVTCYKADVSSVTVANLHFQLSWYNQITLLPPPTQHHSFFRNFHPLLLCCGYCDTQEVAQHLNVPRTRQLCRLDFLLLPETFSLSACRSGNDPAMKGNDSLIQLSPVWVF